MEKFWNRQIRQARIQEFEKIFNSTVRGLMAYTREFVSTDEEAEDIVSEVLTNFWEKMDTVSHDSIREYLFRAARNRSLAYLTHLKVRTRYQDDILKYGTPPEAFSPDFYEESELKEKIAAAVAKLPEQQRMAFVKSRYEHKSSQEIADEMNISPRTVHKHIQLALGFLRRELADYAPGIVWILLFMNEYM